MDRAFTIRGAGTVVTGTLPAGRLRVDDELELLRCEHAPRRVTVRGLQSLGQPHERVAGVARVALNLRGVPREAVVRGDVLLTPGAWLPTAELDVRLAGVRGTAPDLDELPEQLTLHIGSAAVAARVRPLGDDAVRLRLRHPVPLRIGDRAVLRDPGRRRVAAGLTVLDVAPPPLRRRGAAARRAAELADVHGPDAAGELRRRGVVRRADLVAMGVPAPRSTRCGRRARPATCSTPSWRRPWAGAWRPRWPRTTPRTRSTPGCHWRPRGGRSTCRTRGWSRWC